MSDYDNSHNDLNEHRYWTAPDRAYEPTWIDGELSRLEWIEFQASEGVIDG